MDWITWDAGALTPLLTLGFGLTVGLAHAIEPDHVAAVGTQAASKNASLRRHGIRESITKSSVLGAVWGAGHATTLVLFGMLVYTAASLIQDWVFSGLEMVVGAMLLALGASAILGKSILWPVHRHHHSHRDGTSHAHKHEHDDGLHNHTHRSYIIGLVHGLAGSGSLVALTSATIEGPAMMLAFMLLFGAGAAVGMCVMGGLLGVPISLASRKSGMRRLVQYVTGAFSAAMGIMILYQTGAVVLSGAPAA
ncbi:MAG: high frequency lysogenization protein HflD [Nitrosopumilaceae archaeon]|nr:high frequency lysogenization protein HflD [Nitrosopumilaceae archaeon]